MTKNPHTEILKEFDEKFPSFETELGTDHPPLDLKKIKSFLIKALDRQRKEIVEKIEDLKRTPKHIKGYVIPQLEEEEYAYNQAIDDILSEINKE